MSTLEEMVETALIAHFEQDRQETWAEFCIRLPALAQSHREDMRRAITAVLERHVRGMVAEAHLHGQTFGAEFNVISVDENKTYADRKISELKGQKPVAKLQFVD
jgi:hypothetical protein